MMTKNTDQQTEVSNGNLPLYEENQHLQQIQVSIAQQIVCHSLEKKKAIQVIQAVTPT